MAIVLKLVKKLINLIQIFRLFDSLFLFACMRHSWWRKFSRFPSSCWWFTRTLSISCTINSLSLFRTRKFKFNTCGIHVVIHLISYSRWIVVRCWISLHMFIWELKSIWIWKTTGICFARLSKLRIDRDIFECDFICLMLKLHLLACIGWLHCLHTIKDLIWWFQGTIFPASFNLCFNFIRTYRE